MRLSGAFRFVGIFVGAVVGPGVGSEVLWSWLGPIETGIEGGLGRLVECILGPKAVIDWTKSSLGSRDFF